MANVWITVSDRATTNVELPPRAAEWLADELERLETDTPAALDAASRMRQATVDPDDTEVALTAAELDAVRRVFELNGPDDPEDPALRQLCDELDRWTPA
jgi:hypothetical protein